MHSRSRSRPRAVVWVCAGALLVGAAGCLRNPSADAALAEAISELSNQMAVLSQENAELQGQIDSLRLILARQDTVLRRVANLAGVPVP